jgi:Fe-S-cluster containining protein
MAVPAYDCTRCGACCFNPPENVSEGYSDYIEVEPRDELRNKADLLRRYVLEKDGRLHMRLLADQRCKALLGALGGRVRCSIYAVRPSPCRRVQAGSALCQRYRRDHGLSDSA